VARASGLTVLANLAKLAGLVVLVGVLAAGLLLPYVGGAGLAAKAGADKFLNTSCSLKEEPVQQKTTLLASDGKTVIATLFDQNRQVVALKALPASVTQALISTEDRRFYDHHGVDIRGLIRAALHTSGGNTQGASTLTEQYVKQVNYYNAISTGDTAAAQAAIDQNIDRKLSDAQCALKLEKQYTKDQILEKYLNIAFFGENAYGIQTAAQTFFAVDAAKLTVPQAALLVGLVRSPTYYDPYDNLDAARSRRNLVLDNMVDQKYLTPALAAKYKASPIVLAKKALPARGCAYSNPKIINAGYFCDYVTDWLTDNSGLTQAQINTGGLRIKTTLNVTLQNAGERAIFATALDPKSDYLLAMPSVDPRTGAVTSMITDKRYGVKKGDPAYTVAKLFTDAYAGSGSTYKYFTALAALKSGAPQNLTLTAPSPYTMKNCPNKAYRPENAGSYNATLPLDKALPESSNTYFVGMEDQFFGCDISPIVNTATSLGMNYLKNSPQYDTSGNKTGRTVAQAAIAEQRATFTLGQESTPVLELTGAFATLANDGVFCPPTPILAGGITDSTGKQVSFKHPACTRQYDPYVARTLVNIMTADTNSSYGTAGSYFGNWYGNGGSLIAGKTGTNNAADPVTGLDNGLNSALWFVGITPTLTSAAALVNPVHPNLAIANVAGITADNNGADTFGAFASTFWLDAYSPFLQNQSWKWPTVDSTPGDFVQSPVGLDPSTAEQQLTAQGYKPVVLKTACASSQVEGNVAYFSPGKALPGATISLCLSSGKSIYFANPSRTPSKSPGTSSGATGGATPGATNTAGTGNGNGNGNNTRPAPSRTRG
jgi:membrane peptidoglycan carboxypeptidase